ncbi:MAG: glycosyltransferase [SAR324 cluster bacterium]|nr:glycosyltransferase [SAR324 cluster bacterium]
MMETAKSKKPRSRAQRVAMVSTHGYVAAEPPLGNADTGGQVVYVLELSKKMAQLGYEVDIWTRQFEDQPEIEAVAPKVRILRVPCGGNKFIPKEYLYEYLPEWRQNALRFIKKNKIAYQFINSHYWDGGVAAQNLSEELNIPHIHTPHSLGIWKKFQMLQDYPENAAHFEQKYNFKNRIHHELQVYHSCQFVAATTPFQLDLFQKEYDVPKEQLVLLPAGYDDNRFYPVSSATRNAIRQHFDLEHPTVLCLGRMARNKGYDLLIRAFRQVVNRMPNVRLSLAAGGSDLNQEEQAYMDEIKQIIHELELEQYVMLRSYITEDELPDWYRAATVFAMPSRYEPFGMTALEAMACGTATVVTTEGGLWNATTFGRHALYANPFDTEEFGIALYQVLKYPELRARMERMGAHKARSLFTWTSIAQQLISVAEARYSPSMNLLVEKPYEPWNLED